MLKFTGKCLGHGGLLVIETLAVFAVVGVIAVGAAMWRFSDGPVDITFAKSYVQDALSNSDSTITLNADHIQLSWPKYRGPLVMQLDNMTLYENKKEILSIEKIGLRIAKAPLLIGQIALEAVILDEPILKITRTAEGQMLLVIGDDTQEDLSRQAGTSNASTMPMDTADTIKSLLFTSDGMGATSAAMRVLSHLKNVVIQNARLIVEDHTAGVTWVLPQVNMDMARSNNSLDVSINYIPPGRTHLSAIKLMADSTEAVVENRKGLSLELDMDHVDLGFFARNIEALKSMRGQNFTIDGNMKIVLSEDWNVQAFSGNIKADNGTLNLPEYFDEPLTLQDFALNVFFDKKSGIFSLTNTQATIKDVLVKLSGSANWGQGSDVLLPLMLDVPNITMDQVHNLFPQKIMAGEPLEEWLTKNLSDATLRDVKVGLYLRQKKIINIEGKEDVIIDLDDATASFTYDNLTADYRAPLIPIKQASGTGSLKEGVLDIQVEKGMMGDLIVKKGRVQLLDLLTAGKGDAIIDAELTGPVSTVIDYISREPVSLGDTIGMKPSDVGGTADMVVKVEFPTLKDLPADQVSVIAEATLNDAKIPNVVRGLDLTGGPLNLSVAKGAVKISGNGLLAGRPINLSWERYINEKDAPFISEITAKIDADKELRDVFGIDLDDFVKGAVPIDIAYKEPTKGNATVDMVLNLTPVEFFVDPISYKKPVGIPGEATATAILKNDVIQTIKGLSINIGKDKAIEGTLTFGKVGAEQDVRKATFKNVKLGEANDFTLSLEQPKPNTLKVDIKGKSVDARSFLKSTEDAEDNKMPYNGPAVEISAITDQMRTGDDEEQIVKNTVFKVDVDHAGRIDLLDMKAKAGDGDLRVMMKPDATNAMALYIDSSDAGATLRAFDVYENMRGGKLIVRGKHIAGGLPNDIGGIAVIRDFRVVNAPVLAKLVNTLSLSGIGQLLNNQGLVFEKLRSNFTWKEKPTGRVINLSDGRTSGASLGLSFGGIVDQGKGTMDVSGTIVPMSEINNIVGKIPLIGQLLTGGKNGGIIAATYAVKGDSEDPGVFINPLSVLTPGFLRAILFEGGIDFDEDNADSKSSSSSAGSPKNNKGLQQ